MNYDCALDSINIKIDENKKAKLIEYASLVMEYNKNINITGAKTIENFLMII